MDFGVKVRNSLQSYKFFTLISLIFNDLILFQQALIIPENIVLVFLPPYSPELNPAEKIWAKYKGAFSNKFYDSLDDVEKFISDVVKNTTKKEVMSICGYSHVFLDKIWAI